MTETTNTVIVKNPQDVELLYWLKQNMTNIENTLGGQLSDLTLSYSEAVGFTVEYTKKTVPSTPPA